MNSQQLDEREIFSIARRLDSPNARAEYLQQVCGDNGPLSDRVSALLRGFEDGGSFLEFPAAGVTATLDLPPIAEGPGTMIGRYKLLQEIGEGGMGVVFMAEQREPIRRKVALKVIKPGMDSRQVIARFEAERQALAIMDHQNIAHVLDAGATESGRPYFVMELVQGIPITAFCDRNNFTTRQRLELFVTVCQAVQHAHHKGIIHRDIKPSNVMVTLLDGVPIPKIIDFGVAKAVNQQLTDKTVFTGYGQMLGTPLYMSPEQAEMSCVDVDTRSDIYSLGVLLYELLTGSTPFDSQRLREAGLEEVCRIIREEEPARPSQRLSTIHGEALATVTQHRGADLRRLSQLLRGDLDWIVMKALEKDRTRRYESASALAADVERYLHDEPVHACPPSALYRLRKFVRRRKALVLSAAVALVVPLGSLLASTVLVTGAYHREKEQHGLANQQRNIAQEQEALAKKQRELAEQQEKEAIGQRDAARRNLYLADARLAFVDIGLGNTVRARGSLLAHFPDQGDEDRRGWEWYYLLGRSHQADEALYGHRAEVYSIAWSPDGNYIASASIDGSACLWDAKTLKQLRCFDQGPTLKCAIRWSPDSRKLAWGSASDEAALRVWNRDTDKIAVVHGHGGSIWSVAWSHDGKYVATGSIHCVQPEETGNVRIWDAEKLESIAQFTSRYHAQSVSWSPDDKLIAVANPKDGCIIWDLASQQQLPDTVMERAMCAAWHTTDPQLAVGDELGNCLIWDYRSRRTVRQWKAHQGALADLKWSRDGVRLLSCGYDGMVKLWDAKEGREQKSVAAHGGWAKSVDWDSTGRRFASSGTDGVIRVWTVESRPIPLVIDTKLQGTLDLTWDNESSGLLLASGDAGKIGVWEARTGKMLEEIPLAQDSNRRLVSFRHVLQRSASPGDRPAVVSISDVPASVALAKAVSPAAFNTGQFWDDAVLSPDRTRIAYMSPIGRTLIRDLDSDRVVPCPEVLHPAGAAWSPDGRLLAVVGCGAKSDDGYLGYAGWVHVFEADTGNRLRKLRIGASRLQGTAVAWSHDGHKFAAGNEEGLCEIWDARSGRKLVSARIHSSRVHDLAWSLDDRRLASGGINEQVHLWDSSTGQEVLALEPHGSPIRHIRWSPDGRKLAAVSEDGVIRVWDATEGYDLPRRDFWRHLIEPSQWKEYSQLTDEQRWSEAADLLKKMVAAGGPDCLPMLRLALVDLQLDDQATYRETCKRMLATFAGTEWKWDARSTAWVCALRPGTLEDYSAAITLARQALERQIDSRTKREAARADYPETLGAVLFRAGQYEEALRHLQAASERDAKLKQSPARIAFLLAMTHHRLGHATDAQMWLDRANKEADEELNNTEKPPDWSLRLELTLFQREARELIGVQTKPKQEPRVDGVRKRKR